MRTLAWRAFDRHRKNWNARSLEAAMKALQERAGGVGRGGEEEHEVRLGAERVTRIGGEVAAGLEGIAME